MHLSSQQRSLFFRLARYQQHGQLFDTIRPIPVNASEYVIYIRGGDNLILRHVSDLDVLAEVGLLEFQFDRMGANKHFRLSDEGLKVFKTGVFQDDAFTRLDEVSARGEELKEAMADLFSAEILADASTEIKFVINMLDAYSPDERYIRAALRKLNNMLNVAIADGDLPIVSHAMTAFGRWCEAVSILL